VGLGRGNKRHQCAIGLTSSRSVGLAQPNASPASGGSRAVVVRSRVLEFQRGEGLL
jgi:hypothetical protein